MNEITPEQAKDMLKTLDKAEEDFMKGLDEIWDRTLSAFLEKNE